MKESWKSVSGYENIYEVSNSGKVRSIQGKQTESRRHGLRSWEQREMKLKTDKGGYKRVTLWKDKKPKDFLVHRLVAIEFCERPEGKNLINHIDGNPSNNDYTNLEWCDHRDNLMHAYLNKMNKAPNVITLIDIVTKEEKEFYSMAEASRFLGRSNSYVSNSIKQGAKELDGYHFRVHEK